MDLEQLQNQFRSTFKDNPQLFRAPGRVNIIGEHTDYNDGLVLPFPIAQAIYFAASTRNDDHLHIHALNLNQQAIIDLNNLKEDLPPWTRYFIGALKALKQKNFDVQGMNIMVNGDIPFGAGISSSSALTCGFIFTIQQLCNLNITKREIVFLASEAENGTGLNGGKMDQFAICMGEENKAILLDCKDYSFKLIDNHTPNASWYLFNSMVEHNLAETEYNDRRSDCDQGFQIIKQKHPTLQSIREITIDMLNDSKQVLTSKFYDRLLHVINENERVSKMVIALSNHDLKKVGQLLLESHQSLSTLYDVSCPELDFIVDQLKSMKYCHGARMMGGGFGGSVIALLENGENDYLPFKASYKREFDLDMQIIKVESKNGISRVG